MGALTGIVTGVACVVGAVALVKYTERKTAEFRRAFKNAHMNDEQRDQTLIVDFEKDPQSGAYRQRR